MNSNIKEKVVRLGTNTQDLIAKGELIFSWDIPSMNYNFQKQRMMHLLFVPAIKSHLQLPVLSPEPSIQEMQQMQIGLMLTFKSSHAVTFLDLTSEGILYWCASPDCWFSFFHK